MTPTLIYKNASNWVDRGEQPNATLRRILAHFFERFDADDEAWLEEHAVIVLGMVEADATEVHIAGYLRSVVRETGAYSGTAWRSTRGDCALACCEGCIGAGLRGTRAARRSARE